MLVQDRQNSTKIARNSIALGRPTANARTWIKRAQPSFEFRPKLLKISAECGQTGSKCCKIRRFGPDFRTFLRLQCVRDSTCSAESRTLVFAGRRSTFKGSQTLPTDRKSIKIDKKLVQQCFMDRLQTKSRFFSLPGVAQQWFWASRHAPEPFPAVFLVSRAAFEDSPDAPGTCRGRAQTLPGRLQDALGCHGASREPPRADLESILGIQESILDSFSRSTLHNIGQGCPMLPNVARYWVQLRDSAKTCAHLHIIAWSCTTSTIPRSTALHCTILHIAHCT